MAKGQNDDFKKNKNFNILRKIQIQIKHLVIYFAIFKINGASVCIENGVYVILGTDNIIQT